MKRIGLLTSGGDCAGLNAALRAVYARAHHGYGWTVVGIRNGTAGLMERPVQAEELSEQSFSSDLLRLGGTVLGTTNKGNPFKFPMEDGSFVDRSHEVIEGYRMLNLDALIMIGGDGSMAIIRKLAKQGSIPLVSIPKTIDNDIGVTETSIGFETAVQAATSALDHLQPTAASHSRVMVLELMGRDAGHIALWAGIAGGADVILLPEIPYTLSAICEKLEQLKKRGRNFALVVVAEAVKTESGEAVTAIHGGGAGATQTYGGIGQYIGGEIARLTGAETRVTVLGHVQRGGSPEPGDRVIASAFGVHAVDLIAEKRYDRMVAWSTRRVIDVPIEEAIRHVQTVDPQGTLVTAARGLGISFGDSIA
jgi:6-phosphofructokinase 1